MDKKLHEHEQLMKEKIEKIEASLADTKNDKEISYIHKNIKALYKYHREAVTNFQHERLVHLIVTIFFATMQIAAIIATIWSTTIPTTSNGVVLFNLLLIIDLIFFVTGIFYVRHYYQLENGTQRLYDFSQKLYELSGATCKNKP